MFPFARHGVDPVPCARWEAGPCGRDRVERSQCFGLPGSWRPATWTFQGAVQLGKIAMINAIPGTRAATVQTQMYRTRAAKPQRRHSPIGHLAVPMLAAAAGIGFNVFVVMTLLF